jgi:hypothetical protein
MTAAWVAGTVRARALARRRIGIDGARSLLGTGSFPAAVEMLARSPYGHRGDAREPAVRHGVHPGDDPDAAAHGVAAALLWNLRVLAGWLPAHGTQTLRILAGWFEIANTEEHVRELSERPAAPPHALGSLATAWSRIAAAATTEEVRSVLAASAWRDPGGAEARDIQIGLRLTWADRLSERLPAARPWAQGGLALLLARELRRGEPLPEPARSAARRTLGPRLATDASSIDELRASLPPAARWALDGVTDPTQLWRAEANWWRRLHTDCTVLVARSGFGEEPVIGAVGLLAHDAWLVNGALAGVGRSQEALELIDALA